MALSKLNNDSFGDTAVHGRRNLVINGAMQVAQRGTSANNSGNGQYLAADRYGWFQENTDQIVVTVSQDTNAPEGFSNSHKIAVSTAETTLDSNEIAGVYQPIEAQNLQHLKFGTSSAESLTLSFWVKSTETGTYALLFYTADGTARGITKNYTISTANTWEYKTITIDGDTGGTINNDNGLGMGLYWVLSSGSDRGTVDGSSWRNYDANQFGYGHTADVLTDSSATWQITGIQLEVGDKATPFEHRSYGEELGLCQRYYQKYKNLTSQQDYLGTIQAYNSTTTFGMVLPLYRPMRTTPTYGQSGTFKLHQNDSTGSGSATIALQANTSHGWVANGWGGISSLTAGDAVVTSANQDATLTADAEL